MTLRPVGGVPVARIMGIEIRIHPVWILILAVITADRWDEPEQQNERAKSAPWRKVA